MAVTELVKATLRCNECQGEVVERPHGLFNKTEKYCEVCERVRRGKGWKKEGEYRVVYTTECPFCGQEFEIADMEAKGKTCPHCGHVHPGAEGVARVISARDIPDNAANPGILRIHPAELFNASTRVQAEAGVSALFARGLEAELIPPAEQYPFRGMAGSGNVSGRVIFVRNVIEKPLVCGTPNPIRVYHTEEHLSGDFRGNASVRVEIVDALAFARWAGFRACTVDELFAGEKGLPNLRDFVWNAFIEGVQSALEQAVNRQGMLISELNLRKTEIIQLCGQEMNRRLGEKGMKGTILPGWDYQVAEAAVAGRLQGRVERLVEWRTGKVSVHEAGNDQLSAEVVMGGSAQLRLINTAALLRTAEGQRWNDPTRPEDEAGRQIGEQIGRQLNAVFSELMQRMIDDVKAPVRRLDQFLPFLENTVLNFLKSAPLITSRGLDVDSVTVAVQDTVLSSALRARGDVDSAIARTNIEEEMRRFTERLQITQAQDASSLRIQLGEIQTQETETVYTQTRRTADVHTQERLDALNRTRTLDDAQHSYSVYSLQREDEGKRVQEDLDYARYLRQRERAEEAQDHGASRTEAAEDHAAERAWSHKVTGLDQAYEAWQRRDQLRRAELGARLDEENALQRHRLDARRTEEGVDRERQVEDARLQDSIHRILRGIEESDLDWQKKLDAYAYLKQMTEAGGELELEERRARQAVDLETLRGMARLSLSREDMEQVEQRARYAEDREERSRRSEFAIDMERRRFEVSTQIELLKLQMDAEKAQRELEHQLELQKQENERLRLQYEHEDRKDAGDTARLRLQYEHEEHLDAGETEREKHRLDARVNEARTAYDYTYTQQASQTIAGYQQARIDELKADRQNAAETARRDEAQRLDVFEARRREEIELLERNQARIEQLYGMVLDLERQREEMRSRNEWAYNQGRAEADIAEALNGDAKKVDQMFAYLKSIQEQLRQLRERKKNERPPEPPKPSRQDQNKVEDHATTVRRCPKCGAELDKYRTFCPSCGASV